MTRPNPHDLLQTGRENNVPEGDYDGPRPANLAFDPVDLYCYLQGRTTPDTEMDEIVKLFERQFHDLPTVATQEIAMEYNTPTTARLETGDDEPSEQANLRDPVKTFVSNYVYHYTLRNSKPPLGRDADTTPVTTVAKTGIRERPESPVSARTENDAQTERPRPEASMYAIPQPPSDSLGVPFLSEIADAGYRTGRNVSRFINNLWSRITSLHDTESDARTEQTTTSRDE